MRQSKREIKEKARIEGLLHGAAVGRLGTIGGDGYPMIKPLNFVYVDGKIYFHSAKEGEKIADIGRDNRVCFEVDLPIGYVRAEHHGCEASYRYRSVLIRGRARLVEEREERLYALTQLLKKYQPEGGYGELGEDKLQLAAVVRIDVSEMTGKEIVA